MPEEPTTEQRAGRDGPEWPVWLASTQRIDLKTGSRLTVLDLLGCVGFLTGLYILVLLLGFVARAVYRGQGEVLAWLLLGHLPLVWFIGVILRLCRESSPQSQSAPTKGGRTGIACILDDAGIRHGENRLHRWEEIAGCAYDSADGTAFAIRLWRRRRPLEPQPLRRTALHAFAMLTPTGVTVLSSWVGWHRFGERDDVKAALCVAALHLLVAIPLALHYMAEARKARVRPYETTDVLFDSRRISAAEAMERLGRLVPYGAPPDTPADTGG